MSFSVTHFFNEMVIVFGKWSFVTCRTRPSAQPIVGEGGEGEGGGGGVGGGFSAQLSDIINLIMEFNGA